MPTFGSLFAGIGGIDLGLERAGWTGRWQVEWDEYCQHVLAHHWPDIPRYGDITTVDWSTVESVDLIAGGFPCQPFSSSGKQRRLDDDRWLWPEFARAIRELRPRYVLVENVPGLLVGGGMDAVLGDLAELGYDAEWESIPASAVGAPHLRYRIFVVAYAAGVERQGRPSPNGRTAASVLSPHAYGEGEPGQPVDAGARSGLVVQDTDRGTVEPRWWWGRTTETGQLGNAYGASANAHPEGRGSRRAASEPGWWAVEPNVGRVAHGVPARVDRLRALGNAVVPQVVEVIGRRLLEIA